MCEAEYPPDVTNNLDIIFRTVLDPIVPLKQTGPLAQIQQTFKSRFLLEYLIVRHRRAPSGQTKASSRSMPTPVLVLLYPYRPDYHGLVFPVTNLLADRGMRTSILTRRGHFRPSEDFALFQGASFLFEEDFYSFAVYRRARKRYCELVPWLHRLSSRLHLSPDQDRSLKVLYQRHCFQREAFADILHVVQPSVVFALHFILNPGFLAAIDETSAQKERPLKILIQHGYFSSGLFHDFKGADCVLLWGQYSEAVLRSGFLIPVPTSEVVGNPKLELEITRARARTGESVSAQTDSAIREILFVSTVDAPGREYHSRAARLLANAMRTCPLSWHALYRPHPAERMDNYDRLVAEQLIVAGQITPRSAAIYDLLHHADVVCGGNSTALLEAAAMGIPVIQILPGMSGTDWCNQGMTGASTEHELREALQALLTNPERRRNALAEQQTLVDMMFAQVEGSAQGIADCIVGLLERDSGTKSVV